MSTNSIITGADGDYETYIDEQCPFLWKKYFKSELQNFMSHNDKKYRISKLRYVEQVARMLNPSISPIYTPTHVTVIGKPDETGLIYTIQPPGSKSGLKIYLVEIQEAIPSMSSKGELVSGILGDS